MKQGDVLAPLLFSLSVQDYFAECLRDVPDVRGVAIFDDFNLVGHPTSVLNVYDRLSQVIRPGGLQLRPDKCKVLWPHIAPVSPELDAAILKRGLSLVYGAMPVLGGIVGLPELILEWTLTEVKSHSRLFDAIAHPSIPSQTALLILRLSALPRVDYLTRVLPPSVIEPALMLFDTMVCHSVIRKLHLPSPLSDEAHSILRLPIRLGGCGIRSLHSVASAAYFGAVAIAAPFIIGTVARFVQGQPLSEDSTSPSSASVIEPALVALRSLPVSRHIADCVDTLILQGVSTDSKLLPASRLDFWTLYGTGSKRGIQKRLMQLIYAHSADNVMRQVHDPITRAKLISCSVKHSGSWLSVVPSSSDLFLLDSHFALAFRLRLGLPPQDGLPPFCRCGALITADPGHFLSCKLLKQTIVTTRHDLIVRLLASHARFAGGAVYVEPRHLEGKRADAQIFFSTDTSLLDASVIHPASPYYAISTTIASTHLGAARFRERQKHNKYDSQAKSEGASFFPFVLETYGGLGAEGSQFLDKLAKLYVENSPFPVNRTAFRTRVNRTISIILQRGNALVQLAGCISTRDAAGRRVGYS